MAWDWDMDDINVNYNDSKLWVPMMAQMLNTDTTEWVVRINLPTGPVMLLRQMTIYAMQSN